MRIERVLAAKFSTDITAPFGFFPGASSVGFLRAAVVAGLAETVYRNVIFRRPPRNRLTHDSPRTRTSPCRLLRRRCSVGSTALTEWLVTATWTRPILFFFLSLLFRFRADVTRRMGWEPRSRRPLVCPLITSKIDRRVRRPTQVLPKKVLGRETTSEIKVFTERRLQYNNVYSQSSKFRLPAAPYGHYRPIVLCTSRTTSIPVRSSYFVCSKENNILLKLCGPPINCVRRNFDTQWLKNIVYDYL